MAYFETYLRDPTHVRPLYPDTLRFLVETAGFSSVAVQFRQPVDERDRLPRVAMTASAAAQGISREEALAAAQTRPAAAPTFSKDVAPILFANLVFANSFRDTDAADMAFASNLLGAMVGGALEYLALITGYRALLLVVAGLYLGAYVLASRWRVLADRRLERRSAGLPELAGAD